MPPLPHDTAGRSLACVTKVIARLRDRALSHRSPASHTVRDQDLGAINQYQLGHLGPPCLCRIFSPSADDNDAV